MVKIGTTWSINGRDKQAAIDKIKIAFRAFLSVYAKHPVIITHKTRSVVSALEQQVPYLQKELGEDLLGLALGGSSIRGLNIIGVGDSDIDHLIYTRRIHANKAYEINEGSQSMLKAAGFTPCNNPPVIQLDRETPLDTMNKVLGIFTAHFIHRREGREMETRALEIIKRYSDLGSEKKDDLLKGLKFEFDMLSGNHPQYVAKKYMKNIAIKIVGEEMAVSLPFDTNILNDLEEIARSGPYLEARRQLMPFPPQIENLLA